MQNALGTHNMEQGTLAQEKMALWVKAHINLVCKNEYGLQVEKGQRRRPDYKRMGLLVEPLQSEEAKKVKEHVF